MKLLRSSLCDPTCGSGGFLIKAFEYVREQIEEDIKKAKARLRAELEGDNYDALSEQEQLAVNERIEEMQAKLNKELDTQTEGSRMYNLSHNCIYGTDANPRMARTSKIRKSLPKRQTFSTDCKRQISPYKGKAHAEWNSGMGKRIN